jgi:hypothetical protein
MCEVVLNSVHSANMDHAKLDCFVIRSYRAKQACVTKSLCVDEKEHSMAEVN